jgi:ABC transporter substrate-binding protein (ThiB subfamily)
LAKKARELKWKDLPKDLFSRVREDLLVIEGAKFVPIDWSPLTVIYRDEKSSQPSVNHASISAFLSAAKGQSGVLEDPRSSVLGQQWLYWFDQQSVSSSELAATQPKLANSWTQAYGLFKRKSADWVFSYLTSVIFHWEKENDRSYKYMKFESGHPFQVDAAGVLERCKDCDAALKFVEFLLEPASQALIMQKNYMLPAIKSLQPSGLFSELPQLKLISYEAISDFQNKQQETQSRFLDSLE